MPSSGHNGKFLRRLSRLSSTDVTGSPWPKQKTRIRGKKKPERGNRAAPRLGAIIRSSVCLFAIGHFSSNVIYGRPRAL